MRARLTAPVLAAVSFALAWAASAGSSIEGRWRLVEQHYGSGRGNLAAPEAPLRLDLSREGGRLSGLVWAGEDRSKALPWPSFLFDGRPAEVEVTERAVLDEGARVRVAYSVRPVARDPLFLEIVEDYAVSQGGRELAGTLTVRFLRTGEGATAAADRGSYTLHRRFEREP